MPIPCYRYLVWVLALTVSIAARGGPIPQLPTSPTPLVSITAATADKLPQFDSAIVQKFHSNAFLLANESDKAIVGLMALWTFTDANGFPRTEQVHTDSFMQPHSPVLLLPHARLIVAPGAFLPEALAQAPHIGARLEDLDGRLNRDILGATQIKVQIDLVIFEDGEIAGPNETRYDTMIQNRKIAATQIAKQVRNALSNGDDPKITLGHILETAPSQSDSMAVWTNIYAKMLQRSPTSEKQLHALETLPEPPKFYKK
jgi:hypothetical protein